MADFDFNYTVGFTGDFGDIQKKIKVLTDGIKPIDLKAEFPNLDTGNAQKAINEIGKSGTIKALSLETKSFTDAMGNLHEEIVKVSGSYQTLQGHTVSFSQAIPNAITGLEKQSKTYEHMIKKADEWSTRAETMGEKDKTAIQGTSAALKENIAKWEVLKGKYGQASPEARKVQEEIDRLNKELDKNIAASKRSAVATQSWGDRMAAAIKQTVTYTLTIGMVRKAQQELNKAIQFAIQLNTEMTKVQVLQAEGAQTPEEINELAQSFNSLAKEMGTTTIAIAEGSVEWLRQGKTVQETQELLRASTMLSKLGALSAAEATEYLTSTLNSYGMAAEEAVSIVDKLVQVDNISATSTRELATALRYSAATAKEAGVELEQLVSYIAVVSSTTRQNAESIGQGMKTMFTRMQDIKAGAIDEDGLGLNNVESALARVNIALRDTPTSFRDMSAVLEDVAAKWSTLNDIEQANIAKAIAGVRQQNLFMVLMQNMGKALEYQNEQFNANGVALDRYRIYLDSIIAKQEKFKATLEDLYLDVNFQDYIKSIIELGTEILELIKKFGGLEAVIKTAIGVFITYKGLKALLPILGKEFTKQLLMETKAIYAEAIALGKLNQSMLSTISIITKYQLTNSKTGSAINILITKLGKLTTGFIPLAAVILGSTLLITKQGSAARKAAKDLEELENYLKGTKELLSSLEEEKDSLGSLFSKFSELTKKVGENRNVTKLSADELKEYYDVQRKIASIVPEVTHYIDDNGNVILAQSISLDELNRLKQEEIDLEKESVNDKVLETLENKLILYKKQIFEIETLKKLYENAPTESTKNALANATRELDRYKAEILEWFNTLGEKSKEAFLNGLKGIGAEDIAEYIGNPPEPLYTQTQSPTDTVTTNVPVTFTPEDFQTSQAFYDLHRDIAQQLEFLKETKEQLADTPSLTDEELRTLENAGLELEFVNEQWVISEESQEKFKENLKDSLKVIEEINPELYDLLTNLIDSSDAIDRQTDATDKLISETSVLASAMKEQNQNGYISKETAFEIAQANGRLAQSLVEVEGGYRLTEEAIQNEINLLNASLQAIVNEANAGKYNADVKKIMAEVSAYAAQGNYVLAMSAVEAGREALEEAEIFKYLTEILGNLADIQFSMPSFSAGGGGGGSSGPSAEEQAINAEIKALEKKKKEIQKAAEKRIKALEKEKKAIEEARDAEVERLEEIIEGYEEEIDLLEKKKDAFNELIDKQKESLEIAKDADDFARDQAKKATELSTLRTQIANISLDTSEEGIARRLELEQEASELEEEIAEDSAERKYDLQIDALDRMAEAFEEATDRQIEAIELQIEAIEKQIEAVEDLAEAQIEAIEKQIEAIREETDALIEAIDEQIEALREQLDGLKESGTGAASAISKGMTQVASDTDKAKDILNKYGIDFGIMGKEAITALADQIRKWEALGLSMDEIRKKALAYKEVLLDLKKVEFGSGGQIIDKGDGETIIQQHEGGVVESHHSGNFAGNLKSNEVFAKLLKGEYVATENQMDNFLKQVFPKLATHPDVRNISNSNQSIGDIHVNMPITVQGNMDSSVIPQIDQISKRVIDDINKALVARGYIRNSNITIS